MNKGVIIGIVAVAIIVVGAGAFLTIPQAPQARTIELEAKEFAFQGLGFKEFKGGPTIQAKTGETVRIVLKNGGGAAHEFMVVSDVKTASEEAKKGKHPDPAFMEAMIKEVKPGQSATTTFVAEKAGKYFYVCLLDVGTKPDTHADRGMLGEFIVQG